MTTVAPFLSLWQWIRSRYLGWIGGFEPYKSVHYVLICSEILNNSSTISSPVAENGKWICGRSCSTSSWTSLTATTSRTWGPYAGSLRTTSWPTWPLTFTRWWPECRPACGPLPSSSPRRLQASLQPDSIVQHSLEGLSQTRNPLCVSGP